MKNSRGLAARRELVREVVSASSALHGCAGIALVLLAACAPADGMGGSSSGDGGTGNGGNGNGGTGNGGSGNGGTGNGGSDNGGNGDGASQPEWVSGTRLRARVQTSSDGARAFYGWYDRQLQVNCNPGVAADGQMRCLPQTDATTQSGYYSDSLCRVPVGMLNRVYTDCQPTLALGYDNLTCTNSAAYASYRMHVYSITGAFTGTVFQQGTTTCTPLTDRTSFPYTTYTFYSLGAEQPATTYAALTITTE